MTSIYKDTFRNCNSLTDVYYGGNESGWNSISIGTGNEDITGAMIHFNCSSPMLYTVTFNLNYVGGGILDTQYVTSGDQIMAPAKPARAGYSFAGWYANKNCAGVLDYFSSLNFYERMNISNNITLYAKWIDTSVFDPETDAFSFANSGNSFCSWWYPVLTQEQRAEYKYEITSWHYELRLINLSLTERTRVKDAKNSSWEGLALA